MLRSDKATPCFCLFCLQVIACHDYREGNEMKECSNRAIVSARTLPDSESLLLIQLRFVQSTVLVRGAFENV